MGVKENSRTTRLVESLPVGVVLVGIKGRVTMVNHRVRDIFGLTKSRLAGSTNSPGQTALFDQLSGIFDPSRLPLLAVKKTRMPIFGVERQIEKEDGTIAILSINCAPILNKVNQFGGAVCTLEEITDHRLNEEDREKLIEELIDQSRQLEKLNDALKVLLAGRHKDREDFEENIILNLKSLVLPYLERLRASPLSNEQRVCLKVASSNLSDLFSSFGHTLRSQSYGLTPREFEIANLVKQGKPSKEIAEILCISVRSVETHRRAIRRKVGLRGQRVNLRSFLTILK